MADTGSTGGTYSENQSEAAPVDSQTQSSGMIQSDDPAAKTETRPTQSEGNMTEVVNPGMSTGSGAANPQPQDSGSTEPQSSNGNAGVGAMKEPMDIQNGGAASKQATNIESQAPNAGGAGNVAVHRRSKD